MDKVLYFEGAGWSGADISKATIGNCRIRTAFSLKNKKRVYLEIIASEITKDDWRLKNRSTNIDANERQARLKECAPYVGFIDACHYITDDIPNDDCNKHHIKYKGTDIIPYTLDGILKFVNSLGTSFDKIEVVPDLGGYRVFPESNSCNGINGYYYGDEFQYDAERTKRAEEIYSYFYEIERRELQEDKAMGTNKFVHSPSGTSYPNFSLWVDEHNPEMLHLLRHFNGHNKHWSIVNIPNWRDTITETTLGKYAC